MLNINISLFVLGNVVSVFVVGYRYILYCDFMFMKILESSLNGKSCMVLFVCVSFEIEYVNESVNLFDFVMCVM